MEKTDINQDKVKENTQNYEEIKERLLKIDKNCNLLNIRIDSKINENERIITEKIDKIRNTPNICSNYKISIIIPVYNTEKYIKECFNSILVQSIGFHNLEIIFVDDCSTDHSFEIIKEYEQKYPNVKTFKTDKNSGYAGKPRNIGIKHATAEYIMFLDSDDTYYDYACEKVYNNISTTPSQVVSGFQSRKISADKVEYINGIMMNLFTNPENNDEQRKKDFKKLKEKYPDGIIIDDLNKCPYLLSNFGVTSKIFEKRFIENNKIDFPEYIPAEDSVFIYKSFLYAKKITFIYDPISIHNYTRNSDDDKSVSFIVDKKTILGRFKAYNIMYHDSKEKNFVSNFVKILLKDKIQYVFREFLFEYAFSREELYEIFDESKDLLKLLYDYDVKMDEKYDETFKAILNDEYSKAAAICSSTL